LHWIKYNVVFLCALAALREIGILIPPGSKSRNRADAAGLAWERKKVSRKAAKAQRKCKSKSAEILFVEDAHIAWERMEMLARSCSASPRLRVMRATNCPEAEPYVKPK